MSVRQLEGLYQVARDEGGQPKLPTPLSAMPSMRELFRVRCFLRGIYEPALVAELWAAEQVRMAARRARAVALAGERRKARDAARRKRRAERKKKGGDA